jgi:cyanophycinase
MTRLVLAGGRELDAGTAAGQALAGCGSVAVVTLAAAYRRPDAVLSRIGAWAGELSLEHTVVRTVRRSDSLAPAVAEPIAESDGVLVLDGSPAHFVGAAKATPLLDAIVDAHRRGADVVWSGATAAAACASMVDDRGGALTVGLGLYRGIVVAAGWENWPRDRRRRLRRMISEFALFMALESGAAVQSIASPQELASSSRPEDWTVLGGTVEALQGGSPVILAASPGAGCSD